MNKTVLLSGFAAVMLMSAPVFATCSEGHGPGKGGPFMAMDTDGNGALSKEEFLAGHADKFGKLDADGDGEVTKEEMHEGRKKMQEKFQEKRDDRKENMEERREQRQENMGKRLGKSENDE